MNRAALSAFVGILFIGLAAAGQPWATATSLLAAEPPATDSSKADSPKAQSPAARSSDQAAALKKLRSAIEYEVAAKDLPAFSIALVDGDRVVWSEGFGYQDAARKTPATADTIYRVGSVSKLFTDIAAMQLVEAGRVELDAPLPSVLPGFEPKNPFGTPLTLRQLMSHRSGLVREPPVGHYFDPLEPSLAETVESLNRTSLVYPPETRTKYSNAAIAVVGRVVETLTGERYSDRIAHSILTPLGMTNSSFERTAEIEKRLAPATMWTLDGRRFPAPQFMIGTAPAGNLYASVNDLAKFLRCLHNSGSIAGGGRILRPETLQAMMTPGTDDAGQPHAFAIGFHVNQLDGERKIGHGGAVYGCATQVESLPEHKLGVAAVAALDCANGTVERLANYALRLLLSERRGQPLPDYPRTVEVPPERARALVGAYRAESPSEATAEVTYLDGRLFLKHGAVRSEVRARTDGGELVIDDVISYGTLVSSDREGQLSIGPTSYQRLPDQPPEPAKKSWQGLIGEYGWDHDVLFILEDRGRLVALIEWFYAYPLTELEGDLFAFPDYGLYHGEKLKFHRGPDGQADRVVAAEVPFQRRESPSADGQTFRIRPVRPIDELRSEAAAAEPPTETGSFRPNDLVELIKLEPRLALDIRYATTNNFVGSVFYTQPRAFLQRPAAEAVSRVEQRLRPLGLGLLIHDAYRPWSVTKMFWDATPAEMKDFVANPASGSRHNRGCAVDLSLVDLGTGQPIQMVSGYDEFSTRAFPGYPGGTSRQRWNRDRLRTAMEAEGFAVYRYEWWHFDYRDWQKYRLGNVPFESLP